MSPVKAGTAYIDFQGDFSKLNKQVAGELGRITANGSTMGKGFSKGFSNGVSGTGRQVSAEGHSLGRQFASSFESHTRNLGKGISASLHRNAVRGIQIGAAAIGGAFIYAVKQAANFEQQMSTLGAVTGASARQMQRLKREAITAGAATQFSAKQAAQAQVELAKGGLSTSQILRGGLSAALSLAAAGELDLADAATVTVNAMKLFGLHGKNARQVADEFATAANTTTADVKDFALAFTQGGSAAKAAGLTFTDTTAALEALAQSGIKGSDAGTSLKTTLIQLASPTKVAANAMKDAGLKFFDAQGNIKPLADIADTLRERTKNLTREQRLNLFATIGGTDGQRTLNALYEAGGKTIDKYEKGLRKQGTAADLAKKKQDNLAGSFEQLHGSVETLAIEVGTAMIPGIRKVTRQLTNFTNDVTKIFDRKDLDFGEKMNLIFQKAKFRFGPTVNHIIQAIKDAHLDQKLGDVIEWATPKMVAGFKVVGTTAAGALWDAFKAAPIWAQVAGGAFIANKLGLTGAAFKTLTGLFTARGGSSLLSKANPIPVFVVNQAPGSGPGGGGTRVIPTGVPKTLTDRLRSGGGAVLRTALRAYIVDQVSGEVARSLHAGRTARAATRGAAVGGSIGFEVGGPLGALAGAGVGAAGGALLSRINQSHDRNRDQLHGQIKKLVDAGDVRGLQALNRELNQYSHFAAPGGIKQARIDAEKATAALLGIKGTGVVVDNTLKTMGLRGGKHADDLRAKVVGAIQDMQRGVKGASGRASSALDEALKDMNIKGFRHASKTRRQVVNAILLMASGTGKNAGKARTLLVDAMQDMNKKGNRQARNTARNINRAIAGIPDSVGASGASASLALFDALTNMGQNASSILKALGIKPPTIQLNTRAYKRSGINAMTRTTGHAQRGWYVPGHGDGDKVPAMLEPGEYVLNRKAVKKVGKQKLDQVNFQHAPRFQGGGLVTGDTDVLPALLTRLEKLAAAAGVHIFISSGRRTLSEQAALFREKGAYSGTHAGAAPPSPNAPHVRGIAADISPGRAALGALAGKFGLSFPLGNEPWHIQLLDAGAKALAAAVAQHVNHIGITGPQGALRSTAQGLSNRVERAFNRYIGQQTADVSGVGAAPTAAGKFGKAQLKALWTGAGGPPGVANIAAAIALAESTGDPNAHNQSGASGLWQILGQLVPGNIFNPTVNAKNAVAKYRGAGNRFTPWVQYTSGAYRQYLQQGGLAQLFQPGYNVGFGPRNQRPHPRAGAGVPSPALLNRKINRILKSFTKHGKMSKKGQAIRDKFIDKIKDVDLPSALMRQIAALGSEGSYINRYEDYAVRAASPALVDNEKITAALQAAFQKKGSALSDAEQDAIIKPMLGKVNGKTSGQWYVKELRGVARYRNLLVKAGQYMKSRIAAFNKAIVAMRREVTELHKKINDARKRLAQRYTHGRNKGKHVLTGKARTDLSNKLTGWTRRLGLITAPKNGLLPALEHQRSIFTDAYSGDTGVLPTLREEQGFQENPFKKYTVPQIAGYPFPLPYGTFGKRIQELQDSIREAQPTAFRLSAEDMVPDTTDTTVDTTLQDNLIELQRQQLRRFTIGTAQRDIIAQFNQAFPFGGAFKEGGMVPGPIGAPRMILAHGGEVVVPNDAQVNNDVHVHISGKDAWLTNLIDTRVEHRTRTQSRRAQRQLPGQR